MDEKEYLETVKEQIRYEKAKEMAVKELENHIEDQKNAYIEEGMEPKAAHRQAVVQMGDPIEVGIELDRIHRPRMEWKMISLIVLLSFFSILIRYFMHLEMGTANGMELLIRQVAYTTIGLALMTGVCYVDYTQIGKYSKVIATLMNILMIAAMLFGTNINGRGGYLSIGGHNINITILMYLYIPFFGAILYSYKNEQIRGLSKAYIWLAIPLFTCLKTPDIYMAYSIGIIAFIQICYVSHKGWFEKSKKILLLTGAFIVLMPVLLISLYLRFGAAYQKARMKGFYSLSASVNSQYQLIRKILMAGNLIGKSSQDVGQVLGPNMDYYYFTFVFSCYGILAGLLLVVIIGLLVYKAFKISIRQKNQLGMVMGIGCSLVFFVCILFYLLMNLTIIPQANIMMPLFTGGIEQTIVYYVLLGILLSIYRYQAVTETNPIVFSFSKRQKEVRE